MSNSEAQMVRHALAHDDFAGIVVPVGQRVLAFRTFVSNRFDIAEKAAAHALSLSIVGNILIPPLAIRP